MTKPNPVDAKPVNAATNYRRSGTSFSVQWAGALVAAAWLTGLAPECAAQPASPAQPAEQSPYHALNDLAEGVRQSNLTGKPLLVILGMDWCPHTRVIRDELRTAPRARSALNDFVIVEIIGAPADHLVGLLGTHAYPTLVAYSHAGQEVWRVVGETDAPSLATGLSSVARRDRGETVEIANIHGDTSASNSETPRTTLASGLTADGAAPSASEQDSAPPPTLRLSADGGLQLTGDFGALSLTPKALRPARLTTVGGDEVRFVFDPAGAHVLKAIARSGTATEVSYAGSGKLESLTSRPATPDEMTGSGFDPAAGDQDENGHVSVLIFKYDDKDRLLSAHYDEGRISSEREVDLLYGEDGRITSISDKTGHASVGLTYHGPGDPHSVHVNIAEGKAGDIAITYDAHGQIADIAVKGGDSVRKSAASTFEALTSLIALATPDQLRAHYILY